MRWWILAVLFTARLSMAFQFQAVAALTPLVRAEYGVGLADVGLLIGLYLAPGIVVAIPGSALAARFGDKRVVALGLGAMLAGAVLPLLLPGWNVAVAARLLAGAGGVVLNILMTKMLVDWFAGREISTALAVFVNSWPVGIAIALAVLPVVSAAGGLAASGWTVAGVVAVGLLLFAAFFRPAPGAAPAGRLRFVRLPVAPVVLAGLVWALYNAALAMVFSFGPAVLTSKGWSLAEAGSAVSLFMLVFSLAVPLGGIVADRTGRGDAIIVVSMASFAVLMPWVPALPPLAVTAIFVAVGALFALAAGPVMALPSQVLSPEARTFGMGVFFTIYYGVMMVAPRVAGGIAERQGEPGVAFPLGAGMALAAAASLLGFRWASAQRSRTA
jgi:MFS family permease